MLASRTFPLRLFLWFCPYHGIMKKKFKNYEMNNERLKKLEYRTKLEVKFTNIRKLYLLSVHIKSKVLVEVLTLSF